jgi:HTH-type transcriptional regulator/antitoxin HigA
MNVRPIKTDKDHAKALKGIENLWVARAGTPEGDRLDVLATLVEG